MAFEGTLVPSALLYWMGAVAYTLQIYYDFSGYSDMAIGLGEIFGFKFAENFNYPYCSQSLYKYNFIFVDVTEYLGFDNNFLRKLPFSYIQALEYYLRRYVLGAGYYFAMWLKSVFFDKVNRKKYFDCWYRFIGPIKYPSCFSISLY